MAQKSKTQKAKASAARAERKAAARAAKEAEAGSTTEVVKAEAAKAAPAKKEASTAKKADAKPKKKRFQFFRDVKAEMKRVTWPSRQDVIRWSIVVVCALIFFGVFVAVMDNLIVTPILVAISSLGA